MKKKINNKGFVSSSIIYAFFIIFLLLLVYLLSNYSNIRFLLDRLNYSIKNNSIKEAVGDVNLYIYVWDTETNSYELKSSMPEFGYTIYDYDCTNDAEVGMKNGMIAIISSQKTVCNVYLRKVEADIVLNIYTRETSTGADRRSAVVPDINYKFNKINCKTDGGYEVENAMVWNADTRQFDLRTNKKLSCNAYFTKIEKNVYVTYYAEDAAGTEIIDSFKYSKVSNYPDSTYSFFNYKCDNGTVITNDTTNRKLVYSDDIKDNCKAYFKGGNNKVNMIYKKENSTGDAGFTEGKLYVSTVNMPKTGFKFIGYKCLDDGIIKLENGILKGTSNKQDTCNLYFDKTNVTSLITYFVQKIDGTYNQVSSVPETGYIYNSSKSSCTNGSAITIINNVAYTSTSDSCNVYFDIN